MKKRLQLVLVLTLSQLTLYAQEKTTKTTTAPKTTTTAKPKSTSGSKPKAVSKVDIVGEAISKDAKGSVVPLANKEPFKFYTNAEKELLTIEFTDPAFKNSEIVISDNSGKAVKQVQLEGNQTKINVNTERWENGIFVIVLTQHTTQQTIMQKIVLNR